MKNQYTDGYNEYFSYGVREIRAHLQRELTIDHAPAKREQAGADPYNTTGNFDRKKLWSRIGRR